MKSTSVPASSVLDRALRLTGLSLAALAARLGVREATLYKARLGHIPLSAKTRKAIDLLLASLPSSSPSPAHALRSAGTAGKAPARSIPLSEMTDRLAFLHAHATEDELRLLAATIEAFHQQIAARQQGAAKI